MWPVLFTIENVPLLGIIPLSSFGVFLILAVLIGFFVIWRMIQLNELDAEKVIDLSIFTIIGGLIGARILFIALNFSKFGGIEQMVLLTRFPGLSFWGMLLTALLTIRLLSGRFKFNYWKVLDVGILGLFIGISIASIGCLLGSCQYGLPSSSLIAVPQAGVIGNRFPLQIIEFGLFLLFFFYLWKKSFRYHYPGKIASLGFILFGLLKFGLEFFRGDHHAVVYGFPLGYLFSVVFILFGITIIYREGKRSLKRDLLFLLQLPINRNKQQIVVLKTRKSWYNLIVNLRVTLSKMKKELVKIMRLKPNPQNFN